MQKPMTTPLRTALKRDVINNFQNLNEVYYRNVRN